MDQWIVFAVLAAALVLFVWGRWRYDLVAIAALLVLAVPGIIPADRVFSGFGHPAVITVAAVLVVGRGLLNGGLVDYLAGRLSSVGKRPTVHVAALTGIVTVLSAFMNNVGAMALMLPVAIRIARAHERSPSYLLMPMAFGSLLGGMTTLIGTPPNIIIAMFRAELKGVPFQMFDFSPVGVTVASAGVAFIALLGWRLIPVHRGQDTAADLFHIGDYLSEVRVPEKSKAAGKLIRDLEALRDSDAVVIALIRDGKKFPAPSSFEPLRTDDVLVVEGDAEALKTVVEANGLELVGEKGSGREALASEEVALVEAVVAPNSLMVGRNVRQLDLRWRYGANLLAVARQGARIRQRLADIRFREGDVLLIQGKKSLLTQGLANLGCLPLAARDIRIGRPRRMFLSVGLFVIALAAAALGWVRVDVAFVAVAALMLVSGLLSLQEAYESIQWPVIVLLAAMLPVGEALETTGGAAWFASIILDLGDDMPPVVTLVVILVATMMLSDVVNNAAAVILMAPIAVTVASGLECSPDAFLMAVAIGGSSAFLTPIGHQSNTLVLGPGGYRFGDYWRMGLPLEILIVCVAVPLLLIIWPL